MKIVFVIPSVRPDSGIRLVFELSDHLVNMGHDVKLVYPEDFASMSSGQTDKVKRPARVKGRFSSFKRESVDWHDCAADVVKIPTLSPRFLPDADVIVVSSWEIAEAVAQYPSKKGYKVYLIQSDESVWSPDPKRTAETYQKNWCAIATSNFLKDRMYSSYGLECEGPIICGVNAQQFRDVGGRGGERKRIGIFFNPCWYKGFKDGLKAVDEIVRKGADVELLVFGRDQVEKYSSYEFPCRTILNFFPEQSQMCELYSSCDIWLSSSRFEGGCPMPAQEAAACGCAVVSTDVGGIRDCFAHGETALISPPNDPHLLAENLMLLIKDPSLSNRIAHQAKVQIANYTWRRFAEGFIDILDNRMPGKGNKKDSGFIFKRRRVSRDTGIQRGRETSEVH